MPSTCAALQALDTAQFREALYASDRLARHAAMYSWPAGRLPHGWVLDVGCEYGFGSVLINQANPALRVIGLDIDLPALQYSRDMVFGRNLRRLHGEGAHLPVGSGSLSGVYLINVLHLLPHTEAVLAEAWRALQPGGMAVVAVPREGEALPGPRGDHWLLNLLYHMRDLFEEVSRPGEIVGRLPSLPAQSFRLDQSDSPWMALGRKRGPASCMSHTEEKSQ